MLLHSIEMVMDLKIDTHARTRTHARAHTHDRSTVPPSQAKIAWAWAGDTAFARWLSMRARSFITQSKLSVSPSFPLV